MLMLNVWQKPSERRGNLNPDVLKQSSGWLVKSILKALLHAPKTFSATC